jgi:hypothetical protein
MYGCMNSVCVSSSESCARLPVATMDAASMDMTPPDGPQPLTLFGLFPRPQFEEFEAAGHVPLNGAKHIGLRQRLEDAIDRAVKVDGACDKSSHAVLEVTFTPLGLAHYTTTFANKENYYKPILNKVQYWDEQDWQVWHFLQELPLEAKDEQGNVLITTQWREII